ncbi:hypothetical protein CFK37_18945 [Virgibacillus phasianinus]|uniref:DUF4030 domain-containing protein n=1 Tax=Virgibacillus phasianinus TaxID=2017483 RepID=A0A220U8M2_9BACI|nr:DUF4030 domain-containing protein [Virgibacillus phasianinus]ASK64083.1 hypothetical protein CFK37_18945 [Virgibacillus phasianinus]
MSNKIKEELEKIEIPDELHNRVKLGVEKYKTESRNHNQLIKSKKKVKWGIGKKIAFFSSAAVLLFALLIGSAYVSPSIAKVVAKVPYFGLFIKQEEYKQAVYSVILDVTNEKEYKIGSIEASVPKREITLSIIGSKKKVNSIKDDLIKDINVALVDQNFGEYDIEIEKQQEMKGKDGGMVLSQEARQNMKNSQELEANIIKQLKGHNYTMAFPVQVRINKVEKFIYVAVPKTEKRTEELHELLVATSKDYGEFKIEISKIDMDARKQEIRWGKNNIIGTLVGGLMENEDFKVTGFSYSFHPLPLQIKVKTSLNPSDPGAKQVANEIKGEINYFIQHHEKTKEVRNDPYEIHIFGKDKKEIN